MASHIPPLGKKPLGSSSLVVGAAVGIAIAAISFTSPRHHFVAYLLAGGFALLTFSFQIMRIHRQMRRFVVENDQATAALARGDRAQAYQTFWRWAETSRSPRAAALARHNLAWTMARQGHPHHAIDVATDNDRRYAAELTAMHFAASSAISLALYHALAGDLDAARTWLATTEQRAATRTPASLPGMLAFVRAVVFCRSNALSDAGKLLDERWPEYEATLTGEVLRPLRVIRAFALASPRDAGNTEIALSSLRPAYPGEYDLLAAAWPEMAAFLATHHLA